MNSNSIDDICACRTGCSSICFHQTNVSIYTEYAISYLNLIKNASIQKELDIVYQQFTSKGLNVQWFKPKMLDLLQNVVCHHFIKNNRKCLKVDVWDNNLINSFISKFTVDSNFKLAPQSYKQFILTCVRHTNNINKFHQQFLFKLIHHQYDNFMVVLQVFGSSTSMMHNTIKVNGQSIHLTGIYGTLTSGEYYMGNSDSINHFSQLLNFKSLFMNKDGSANLFIEIEYTFDAINDE